MSDSSVTELLLELGRRGATLGLRDGELKLSAPKRALDPELLERLRAHKPALIARLRGGSREPIAKVPRDQPIPLSPAQARMWFLKRLEAELGRFNVAIAARVRGEFDPDALARSLETLVARHEILRTRYEIHGSAAVQVISDDPGSPLRRTDGRALDEPGRAAALADLLRTPVNDDDSPPVTVRVLEFGDRDRAIAVTLRDIALDSWSRRIFVTELARCYAAEREGRPVELPPVAVQYADWCAWQQQWLAGPEAAEQLRWWTQALADLPGPKPDEDGEQTGIPGDLEPPRTRTMAARLQRVALPRPTVEALRRWTAEHGATVYAALLSAFAIVATRRAGSRELVVGSPVANREHPDAAAVLGFLANNVVLRLPVDPDASPTALLHATRDRVAAAMQRQAIPVESIVEALGLAPRHDRTPLFQILVALNAAAPAPGLGDASFEALSGDELLSRFDLELLVEESEGTIAGWFKYDTQRYRPETIAALADDLACVAAELPRADSLAQIQTPAIAELPPPWRSPPAQPALTPLRSPTTAPRGPIETGLAELYAELLGVPVSSTAADFFALGGHSLVATRLVIEVRRRFDVQLPVHVLLERPGIVELAAWISERRPAPGQAVSEAPRVPDSMLLLRQAPGDRVVFVLPPGIGSPTCYADMDWPEDVSVWGPQIPGLFEAEPPAIDLDALIRGWADAIQIIQPQGPHALVGWSLGALLAVELCAELEGRGARVDFLGLIDGGPLPGEDTRSWRLWARAPGRPRDALRIWGAVRLPEHDELRRWLSWCGVPLPRRGGPRPSLADVRALAQRGAKTLRSFTRNVLAASRHRLRRCAAPIWLIRAEEQRDRPDPLLARVRACTCGPVELLYARGNHMTMMLDPEHRSALSRQLGGLLEAHTQGAQVNAPSPPTRARTGT